MHNMFSINNLHKKGQGYRTHNETALDIRYHMYIYNIAGNIGYRLTISSIKSIGVGYLGNGAHFYIYFNMQIYTILYRFFTKI